MFILVATEPKINPGMFSHCSPLYLSPRLYSQNKTNQRASENISWSKRHNNNNKKATKNKHNLRTTSRNSAPNQHRNETAPDSQKQRHKPAQQHKTSQNSRHDTSTQRQRITPKTKQQQQRRLYRDTNDSSPWCSMSGCFCWPIFPPRQCSRCFPRAPRA